jgi:hypothetical protein
MVAGKLYGTVEERLTMLALLLESVGADKRCASATQTSGAAPSKD